MTTLVIVIITMIGSLVYSFVGFESGFERDHFLQGMTVIVGLEFLVGIILTMFTWLIREWIDSSREQKQAAAMEKELRVTHRQRYCEVCDKDFGGDYCKTHCRKWEIVK